MCWCDGEIVNHLLLHFSLGSGLWNFVFQTFGIQWVLPRRIIDLLFGWRNWLGKHNSDIWNLVPLCLMWYLWQERNRRTFEEVDIQYPEFMSISLACYLNGLVPGIAATSVTSFLDSLNSSPNHSLLLFASRVFILYARKVVLFSIKLLHHLKKKKNYYVSIRRIMAFLVRIC